MQAMKDSFSLEGLATRNLIISHEYIDNPKGTCFLRERQLWRRRGWTWEDQEVGEIGIQKARVPNNQLKINL